MIQDSNGVVEVRKERMNSGTGLRVLTAAILIPVVIALIWWGPSWLFTVVSGLIAVIALVEFFSIAAHHGLQSYRLWTCLVAAGVFVQQWSASHAANLKLPAALLGSGPSLSLELVLFVFVMGLAVIALGGRKSLSEVLPAVSVSAAGLLFVVLPFSTVVRLQGVEAFGPQLILFTVVLVWVGDTSAYFAGRGFGRWKLAPQISPNKTWEGAVANFLGSLLVAVVCARWLPIPLMQLLAMAALGNVAGQVGDLFESAWKRSAGVKDSGTILPGHGGMLDRIDALILAAPAVWYYFEWAILKK